MRRIARGLLLLFAFTIPWEYSLDLGPPLGNIARLAGFLVFIAAVAVVLQRGRVRRPGSVQILVLALFLWYCCTCLWSVDALASSRYMRGYLQEIMVVWLVWELADSPADLRWLLRAYVAGSCVLALLTMADWASPEAVANGQTRFVAEGQDPNDVARFLDLAFPMAALLVVSARHWTERVLAAGYLPLGLLALLLTASRGGFLAGLIALTGCAWLLARGDVRSLTAGLLLLPISGISVAVAVPHATYERLATISEQLNGGDLNQRLNIWSAGWEAFAQSPWVGRGAGVFVSAAHLAPADTAHNSIVSLSVSGGLCALLLAAGILLASVGSVLQLHGKLRLAMATVLMVWAAISLVATVEESRTTWLTIAIVALAGRLAVTHGGELDACFVARPTARPTTAVDN